MEIDFAERLEKVFETVRKPNGEQYTNLEVEKGTTKLGVRIDSNYIYKLRKGAAKNPSLEKILALARFFQINPAYFVSEETPSKIDLAFEQFKSLALRSVESDDQDILSLMARMLDVISSIRAGDQEQYRIDQVLGDD